ncbi:glycosyltransferase [Deinococcus fonticola]|uniref:glycosyltransferase n=1 Tax=Deinococcus fonticola TaxID=2528713 RepID=UPI001074A3F4|nr:glycosyltransferase [Deinococcus fonticola]
MKLERAYLGLAFAFFALKGATLLVNALTFPRLKREAPTLPADLKVSILVPARDEAHNLPRTLPGVLNQPVTEVLLLDDGSQDGTPEVARRLGAQVLMGLPLPPGWMGKSWACQQLAQAASGDILIFTDADVRWQEGAAQAVVHELWARQADLLTVLPRPEDLTLGARFLTPLVDNVVQTFLPYPLLQTRWPLATTANGAVMAFRREAYWSLGGHATVKMEMLEDTVFARHLKAGGHRVTQASGQTLIGVRMYRSYPESIQGFSKNAVGVHLNSRPLMVGLAVWQFAAYTLPWLLPARTLAWQALRAMTLLERTLVNLVTGRHAPADLLEGLLGPITPLLALPGYRRALKPHVTWKGRDYPQ